MLAEGKTGLIEYFISEGKPFEKYKDEIIETTDMVSFSHAFGWKPEYIEQMDEELKMKYKCILKGANKE